MQGKSSFAAIFQGLWVKELEEGGELEDEERDKPGEDEGMEDHEPSPLTTGFAAKREDRCYTREVQQHKEHEREGREGRETSGGDISSIQDSKRRDDSFLGRQACKQAY